MRAREVASGLGLGGGVVGAVIRGGVWAHEDFLGRGGAPGAVVVGVGG